ncbi:MAG: DNA adenine methylase [Treponemataceae bacterium]
MQAPYLAQSLTGAMAMIRLQAQRPAKFLINGIALRRLCPEYTERMQNAQIECCDTVKIIKSRDSQQAFMYCDPPYVGSYQKP